MYVPNPEKEDSQQLSIKRIVDHEKQFSHMTARGGLNEDSKTGHFSPLSESDTAAPSLEDGSKDEKLPFHIADLEDTDSVFDDSNFPSSESKSDIPILEDTDSVSDDSNFSSSGS